MSRGSCARSRFGVDPQPGLAHHAAVTSAAPSTQVRLPRAFGRYVLFDDVGRGGMAEIYLARLSTESGAARHVVVKEILPHYSARADFAEMLVREAKLAARLNHKNVVQVFDLGRNEDKLFIAMEYVEGFDLSGLLKKCSKERVPFPPEFALLIVMETLAGLDYAHRAKGDDGEPLAIVHRDVSPSNVLISFDGEIKVCDFGIARANDNIAADPDEAIKGKAGYMSPEHARGESIDARADVFAAGILLWEIFAGRKLYSSKSGSLIEQARAADIPPLPERDLPEKDAFNAIVRKALAPNRDDRYASAAAMLRDLEDYVRTSKLAANAIKLGDWMMDHFGEEIVTRRRARERAAQAITKGPAVVLTAIGTPPPPSVRHKQKDEPAPESLVGTSVDVPFPLQSAPAVVRDSDVPVEKNKLNPWLWVTLALVLLGGLWSAIRR